MLKLIEVEVSGRDRLNETPAGTCGLCGGRVTYVWACPLRIIDAESGNECCPWHVLPEFEDIDATVRLLFIYSKVPGAPGWGFRIQDLLNTQRQQAEREAAIMAWEKANPDEVARRQRIAEQNEATLAHWKAHPDEHKEEDEMRRMMLAQQPNLMKIGPA
jgi:hypothetical protein